MFCVKVLCVSMDFTLVKGPAFMYCIPIKLSGGVVANGLLYGQWKVCPSLHIGAKG